MTWGPWQLLLVLFLLAIHVVVVGLIVAVVYFVLKSQKPQISQNDNKSAGQEIKS